MKYKSKKAKNGRKKRSLVSGQGSFNVGWG